MCEDADVAAAAVTAISVLVITQLAVSWRIHTVPPVDGLSLTERLAREMDPLQEITHSDESPRLSRQCQSIHLSNGVSTPFSAIYKLFLSSAGQLLIRTAFLLLKKYKNIPSIRSRMTHTLIQTMHIFCDKTILELIATYHKLYGVNHINSSFIFIPGMGCLTAGTLLEFPLTPGVTKVRVPPYTRFPH